MVQRATSISVQGPKHDQNEDAVLLVEEAGVVAVADGMSQPEGGHVASELAVQSAVEYLNLIAEEGGEPDEAILKEALLAANHVVFQGSQQRAECLGMGTTLTVGSFHDGRLYLGHVGDSRVCLFRNNQLKSLTSDHCVFNDGQKQLARAVGIDDWVEVDTFTYAVEPNDIVLFGTDGLFDFVQDDLLERSLRENKDDFNQLAKRLVQMSRLNASDDDVTIAILAV